MYSQLSITCRPLDLPSQGCGMLHRQQSKLHIYPSIRHSISTSHIKYRCTDNALADYRPADHQRQIIGRSPIVHFRTHLRSLKCIWNWIASTHLLFHLHFVLLNVEDDMWLITESLVISLLSMWTQLKAFFVVLLTKTHNRPPPPIIGQCRLSNGRYRLSVHLWYQVVVCVRATTTKDAQRCWCYQYQCQS